MKRSDVFIGVCYPSRGTGHDPTFAGIQREIEPYPHARPYFYAFYERLPRAHNTVTRLALADPRVTHLWYLENDHLLPAGILAEMFRVMEAEHAPVVSGNYLFRGGGGPIARRKGRVGDTTAPVVMVPTGCLLVKREVFAILPDPPFRTTARHTSRLENEELWTDTGKDGQAAGDIYFSHMCLALGVKMAIVDEPQVGHLELVEAGAHTINGLDHIRLWGGTGDLQWAPPRYETTLPEYVKLMPPRGRGSPMEIETRYARKWIKRGWRVLPIEPDDSGGSVIPDDDGTQLAAERTARGGGTLVPALADTPAQAGDGDGHATPVRPALAQARLAPHPQGGVRDIAQGAAVARVGIPGEDADARAGMTDVDVDVDVNVNVNGDGTAVIRRPRGGRPPREKSP